LIEAERKHPIEAPVTKEIENDENIQDEPKPSKGQRTLF